MYYIPLNNLPDYDYHIRLIFWYREILARGKIRIEGNSTSKSIYSRKLFLQGQGKYCFISIVIRIARLISIIIIILLLYIIIR
jgi:hypothetical protein